MSAARGMWEVRESAGCLLSFAAGVRIDDTIRFADDNEVLRADIPCFAASDIQYEVMSGRCIERLHASLVIWCYLTGARCESLRH